MQEEDLRKQEAALHGRVVMTLVQEEGSFIMIWKEVMHPHTSLD